MIFTAGGARYHVYDDALEVETNMGKVQLMGLPHPVPETVTTGRDPSSLLGKLRRIWGIPRLDLLLSEAANEIERLQDDLLWAQATIEHHVRDKSDLNWRKTRRIVELETALDKERRISEDLEVETVRLRAALASEGSAMWERIKARQMPFPNEPLTSISCALCHAPWFPGHELVCPEAIR